MSKSYYTSLGVDRSASKDDIKKAFHRLARKYHPDNKTTGDEQKFKEINEAYHTLSDDRKRAEYDSYGHVFSGGAGSSHASEAPFGDFGGFDFDIGEMFGDFFGGGGGSRVKRGRDISIDLEIPFVESVHGTERRVLLTKTSPCDVCGGKGAKPGSGFTRCGTCNGQGRVHETRSSFLGSVTSVRECSACRAAGQVPEEKCVSCRGMGVLRKQEEILVRIPSGIQDGEMIRLSGMGEAVSAGVSGDLYVKVHILPDPVFRREGANLVMDLDIKLSDALLGGEYAVRLLDNSEITLKVPAGVSFGETLRVRGKGVPRERGRSGDLLVKLDVKLPSKLSGKAKKLIEELKKEGI